MHFVGGETADVMFEIMVQQLQTVLVERLLKFHALQIQINQRFPQTGSKLHPQTVAFPGYIPNIVPCEMPENVAALARPAKQFWRLACYP